MSIKSKGPWDLLKEHVFDCTISVYSDLEYSDIEISIPEKEGFGDLSINLAMKLAKKMQNNPRKIASDFINSFLKNAFFKNNFQKIEIAGPGFINFYFSATYVENMIQNITSMGSKYGRNLSLSGKTYLIEFVSANPTGPLTIAHARQAIVGDCLSNILKSCGAKADKEYYLNDRGVQITTLGQSVFARYLESFKKPVEFLDNYYQGSYIIDIAKKIKEIHGDTLLNLSIEEGGSKLKEKASEWILDKIKTDLKDFGVNFDSFFSELSLLKNKEIESTLEYLSKNKHTYDKDGATWFESTKYGDDKDRVLVKSDGEYTYLTSDIPYHRNKLDRKYDHLIDLMGPDHHGYIARLKASVSALGYNPDQLHVLIVQLVTLYRGTEQIHMSTRRGEFISLRELLDEVGCDAARYFFAKRKTDAHLDFDLELAKKQTNDNPVFYVQYAGARINRLLEKGLQKHPEILDHIPQHDVNNYYSEKEIRLSRLLSQFEEVLKEASQMLEPSRLTGFLDDLAKAFQKYYSSGVKIISDDQTRTYFNIRLCLAIRQVLENGLDILGIKIPERM